MARQIATALAMSVEERRERWHSMVGKLRTSSVQSWFADFLHALVDARRAPLRLAIPRPASVPLMFDLTGTAQRH